MNDLVPTESPCEPPLPGAAFSLAGPGFRTGLWNRVELRVCEGTSGWFRRGGRAIPVWGADARPGAEDRCTRCHGVGPLEHLSAAALVAGIRGWVLAADHPDLPLFDGSALPWAAAFAKWGPISSPSPCPPPDVAGIWRSPRGGVLEAEPSARFRLEVEWTRGPFGPERWSGGADDLASLLGARTFATADEWLAARDAGALGGTGVASGRLLRGSEPSERAMALAAELGRDPADPVWTGGSERMPDECAAHKALDLVGDIGTWMGYLPALNLRARDAGHDLHHLLGRALRDAGGHT